ncbi:hypothetical protein [Brevibacillus porteri]|uniref:hypothetical protein n=1 Tax=Brevibacillus porteri TaxID=2126350 RepID=UPI003D1A8D9A
MSQIEFDVTEGNELVLMESRTMRDQFAFNDSVLERVKAIPELPGTVEVTIEMAANYYDCPVETVRTIVKRHRDEFNDYGELRLLKGKALTEFKGLVQGELDLTAVPSLTLISRRGLLRIGMLLTDSEVARSVRHYLLNVEEISDKQRSQWAAEREIARRERRQLTDAIRDFYEGKMKGKGFEYSTFTDLVYRVLFDTPAKGMRELYDLDKGDSLRDCLSTEDLRKVVRAEQTVASLLLLGKEYQEIKEELYKSQQRLLG